MPLFHVGFVVSCLVKSESCGVFHVRSRRVYVCDSGGIESHWLESVKSP